MENSKIVLQKIINDVWSKNNARETEIDNLLFELELYKKILELFQIGDYYFFIFNMFTYNFDLVSNSIVDILGYDNSDITLDFLMNLIHPEDRVWFANFEKDATSFLLNLPVEKRKKYKIRMDFRVRKKNGDYIRILHQTIILELSYNGGALRTLGVHTDITHLKPFGIPQLSYIGIEGEPSFYNVKLGKPLIPLAEPLTKREKEILRLIIMGKNSTEIADILFLSKQTIDTHRKNMLNRNRLKHSGELIAVAIRNGWI